MIVDPSGWRGRAEGQAFAQGEHSDGSEPSIIAGLRRTGVLALSLVATEGDDIVGHIAFSSVTVDGTDKDWFGFGLLSVRPDRQSRGVSAALVREGLERLRSHGAEGCVVLGNPAYYRRFGFEKDAALRYEGAPPDYFMRLGGDVGDRAFIRGAFRSNPHGPAFRLHRSFD